MIFDTDEDGVIGESERAIIREIETVVKIKNTNLTPDQRNYINSKIDLINSSLSSDYGKQKINENFNIDIDNGISKIEGVINKVTDAENKAFLQTDLGKLFLIDYNNQFNITLGMQMERFLQGELVALGENNVVWVQIKGKLGIEDLLNFYLNTKYGQDHPADLIRRFSNILEEVGISNISLTQEDAKFLLTGLDALLGERYKQIIEVSLDNLGIRNLIQKAFTLVADNSARFYGIDYWQRLQQMNNVISAQLQSCSATLQSRHF